MADMTDPFAEIQNEAPQSDYGWRASLLADARRGFAPVRKAFVQRPQEEETRPSILGRMVEAREELPLKLLLLVLALEPLCDDLALPAGRWAGMISSTAKPCGPSQLARAIQRLEDRHLIRRVQEGRLIRIVPLLEDGSGQDYVRPTAKGVDVGKGYFAVPHEFWDSGLADHLRLPGTAMFLVTLHDTTQQPAFQVALEQMADWYGISERTAERGYRELGKAGVLLTHPQSIRDRRSPTGLRTVTWRALAGPYSQQGREVIQATTRQIARKKAAKP